MAAGLAPSGLHPRPSQQHRLAGCPEHKNPPSSPLRAAPAVLRVTPHCPDAFSSQWARADSSRPLLPLEGPGPSPWHLPRSAHHKASRWHYPSRTHTTLDQNVPKDTWTFLPSSFFFLFWPPHSIWSSRARDHIRAIVVTYKVAAAIPILNPPCRAQDQTHIPELQ